MAQNSAHVSLTRLHPFTRNVIALAAWWSLLSVLMMGMRRITSEWPGTDITITSGCAIAIPFAVWLRARLTTWFLAGQASFGAVELAIHATFGVAHVQGGVPHLSVMAAGLLGAIIGSYVQRGTTVAEGQRVWNASDVFGSVLRLTTIVRRRSSLTALVLASLVAFAVPEILVRLMFGWSPPRWEGLTDLAIFCAAVVAALLGALTEWAGDRIPAAGTSVAA